MESQLKDIQTVTIENLQLDPENPRFDRKRSQREALSTFANKLGDKLYNLAEGIVDKGYCPFELPIVTPANGDGKIFIVLEGNRRIAALKLLSSVSLVKSLGLPAKLADKYAALCARANSSLPKAIACSVMSREDAKHWILLRHTGENDGIGVLPWDGPSTHRFRGGSPALQAVDMVDEHNLVDKETREKLPTIPITNIERVLGTPEARELLGVEVKDGKLFLKSPEDVALARLAEVVADVAHGRKKVTDLDTKDQRVAYAQEVAAKCKSARKPSASGQGGSGSGGAAGGADGSRAAGAASLGRRTVAPPRLKLPITEVRIGRILSELQKLNVEKFTNSSAVLLRVFVEMSVDCYAERNKIRTTVPLGPGKGGKFREMTLREKLTAVVQHMDANKVANKHELQGIRALIADRHHVFSVESWHGYVHNRHYNPDASNLKTNWDNIQAFVVKLWPVCGKKK